MIFIIISRSVLHCVIISPSYLLISRHYPIFLIRLQNLEKSRDNFHSQRTAVWDSLWCLYWTRRSSHVCLIVSDGGIRTSRRISVLALNTKISTNLISSPNTNLSTNLSSSPNTNLSSNLSPASNWTSSRTSVWTSRWWLKWPLWLVLCSDPHLNPFPDYSTRISVNLLFQYENRFL